MGKQFREPKKDWMSQVSSSWYASLVILSRRISTDTRVVYSKLNFIVLSRRVAKCAVSTDLRQQARKADQ